jgi:hypothetical protein
MNGQKEKYEIIFRALLLLWGKKNTYPMGNIGPFCGHKWRERGYDYSRSYSAEIKNAWSYTHTPPHVLMAWISIKNRYITSPILLPHQFYAGTAYKLILCKIQKL